MKYLLSVTVTCDCHLEGILSDIAEKYRAGLLRGDLDLANRIYIKCGVTVV